MRVVVRQGFYCTCNKVDFLESTFTCNKVDFLESTFTCNKVDLESLISHIFGFFPVHVFNLIHHSISLETHVSLLCFMAICNKVLLC